MRDADGRVNVERMMGEQPYGVCVECRRKTWAASLLGKVCGVAQPDGSRCTGTITPLEELAMSSPEPVSASGLTPGESERVFCRLAGPGRGDCEHFVGVPAELNEQTCDGYGIPHGWCEFCWESYLLERAKVDVERFRRGEVAACELVAKMHAAARGSVIGPRLGVVEDVTELADIADRLARCLKWARGLGLARDGEAEVWLEAKADLDRYAAYTASAAVAGADR